MISFEDFSKKYEKHPFTVSLRIWKKVGEELLNVGALQLMIESIPGPSPTPNPHSIVIGQYLVLMFMDMGIEREDAYKRVEGILHHIGLSTKEEMMEDLNATEKAIAG